MGPEQGSWRLEEVSVTNSRERLTQQFICRDCLGTADAGAAYMTPLPPGAVVYGSGEQAVLLTKVRRGASHSPRPPTPADPHA